MTAFGHDRSFVDATASDRSKALLPSSKKVEQALQCRGRSPFQSKCVRMTRDFSGSGCCLNLN
jgi:hypothetical protein